MGDATGSSGSSLDGKLVVFDQLLTFCSQAIERFDQLFADHPPDSRALPEDASSLDETVDHLRALVRRAVSTAPQVDPSGRIGELIDDLYDYTLLVIAAKHRELAANLDSDLSETLQQLGPVEVGRAYLRCHQELHSLVAEIYRRGPEA